MKKTIIGLISLTFIFAVPVQASAASLALSPATGTFNKGCSSNLDIVLDTGGEQTDGTDAILIYDNSRFTANSITSGTLYADYPGNNVDDATGRVTISGLASVSQAFSGKGVLGTVNFTVKENAPAGATQIKFDFDPNDKTKTTDSNVVQRGTVVDILSSVTNGSYTVGTGACGAQTGTGGTIVPAGDVSAPSGGVETKKPIPTKTLPSAGSESLTFTLAIIGSTLTILGVLGLALL